MTGLDFTHRSEQESARNILEDLLRVTNHADPSFAAAQIVQDNFSWQRDRIRGNVRCGMFAYYVVAA